MSSARVKTCSPRSARGLAPPPPAPDDPRRRRRRGHRRRATHMCGFLLKALVMSFTTRCTSTATSSLVSAMLAASAAARERLRESAEPPAGVPGERARERRFGRAPAPAVEAAAEHFRVSPRSAGVWSLTRLRLAAWSLTSSRKRVSKRPRRCCRLICSYLRLLYYTFYFSFWSTGDRGGRGPKVTPRARVWPEYPAQSTRPQLFWKGASPRMLLEESLTESEDRLKQLVPWRSESLFPVFS